MRRGQHQRRQPAGLELADRTPRLRRPRRQARRPVRPRGGAGRQRRAHRRPSGGLRAQDREHLCARGAQGEHRRAAPDHGRRHGGGLRHLPRRGPHPLDLRDAGRSAPPPARDRAQGQVQGVQHRSVEHSRAREHAGGGGIAGAFGLCPERIARLAPAPRPHRARRRHLPQTFDGALPRRSGARDRLSRRRDHQVAAGRTALRRRRGRQSPESGGGRVTVQNRQIEVLRYDPERDETPRFETFTVPCKEEWVVLDALTYIKDELDPSLTFRWSCHMAVCGSCGMQVDNKPTLSCKAFVRDYGEKIRVEPLANFPIERDLVISQDDFMEKLQRGRPWIIPEQKREVEDGPYVQTPMQLDDIKEHTMCINCLLCYAACPVYALERDFVGPAALTLMYRYNADSRDAGWDERREVFAGHGGVWECSFVGACSDVCPKHVEPATAIQKGKMDSAVDYFTRFLMPGGGK
ncbi:MAG: succinate dehydrogenase/fumarate reductase iron-sulfur subunit [Alphaproteobacteria bacterium]|nr:succinate dehydrogenase/fumarate reductase iron-sulfur subunit [Alphaproteobacteria bacterium]